MELLPLKFLYIDEKNQCTVKTTNEPLNIFYELYGYEQLIYLHTPNITKQNMNNCRERAYKYATDTTKIPSERVKMINNLFDKAESHPQFGKSTLHSTPNPRDSNRFKSEGIQIASIPTQYTNGKHLCVAWKKSPVFKKVTQCADISYIISASIGDSLWGKDEKRGQRPPTKFIPYDGNAILFDFDTPQPFKFPMPTVIDGVKRESYVPPIIKGSLFEQVLMSCKQHFTLQSQQKKDRARLKQENMKNVYSYMKKPEVVTLEDEYQQILKKHLLVRCDKPELFEQILQYVLQIKKRDDEFIQWRLENKISAEFPYK